MTKEKTADIGELITEIEGAEWWESGDADGNIIVSTAPERLAQAYAALEARCAELEKERNRYERQATAYYGEAQKGWIKFREAEAELATLRDRMEREPVVTEDVMDRAIDAYHAKAGKTADWDGVEAAIKVTLASVPERVEAEPVAWIKNIQYRRFVRFTDPKCGSWHPVFYASAKEAT